MAPGLVLSCGVHHGTQEKGGIFPTIHQQIYKGTVQNDLFGWGDGLLVSLPVERHNLSVLHMCSPFPLPSPYIPEKNRSGFTYQNIFLGVIFQEMKGRT